MKFVFAHPGVGQFVQHSARALLDADLLARYWTTFADQRYAMWRRCLVSIAKIGGLNLDTELKRRAIIEIPPELLSFAPGWELVRSCLGKLRVNHRLMDAIWGYEILSFDRTVARRGLKGAQGIYSYGGFSLASFMEAKKRGMARVCEVSGPAVDFVNGIVEQEMERFPELAQGIFPFWILESRAQWADRERREWALSDVVIVNSAFTRATFAAAGFDVTKVRIVALGAPEVEHCGTDQRGISGPLRVLWAGNFGILKGAHYLLSAWRNLSPSQSAVLEVYGTVTLPVTTMTHLPDSVHFFPTVPKERLFERYRVADVLVLPTLCDGFGMVVTEALAHGLPVITTTRAGSAEFIRDGENGFVIPPNDATALAGVLEWCVAHRTELKAMRQAAIESAARWQWRDFRQSLVRNVIAGLHDAGYTSLLRAHPRSLDS
jgi:glycosyltransferase involved in cell wall biosynthesis